MHSICTRLGFARELLVTWGARSGCCYATVLVSGSSASCAEDGGLRVSSADGYRDSANSSDGTKGDSTGKL